MSLTDDQLRYINLVNPDPASDVVMFHLTPEERTQIVIALLDRVQRLRDRVRASNSTDPLGDARDREAETLCSILARRLSRKAMFRAADGGKHDQDEGP